MLKLWLKVQLLLAVSSFLAESCKITIPTDLSDPHPVIVTKDGLFRPTQEVTNFAVGESITLHCAGKKNLLEGLKTQTATFECQKSGSFYNRETKKTYALKDISCSKTPTSDLLVTETQCANGAGLLYKIGFEVNGEFLSVLTVCYDTQNERSIYTTSVVNGKAQSFKINDSARPSFRADGVRFTTAATNKYYTIKSQKKLFEGLLGANQELVSTSSFLARGHLAPDADFVFTYEQMATYFYANCAPEWQVVNAGNWVRVENWSRKLASAVDSDLLTLTGTFGVLEIADKKKKSTPIYLDNKNLIPAPKWYYKVLIHPDLPVDLVAISLNNPFADVGKEVEFCTNVCEKYNFGDSAMFSDPTRGYTFCCELGDFWATAMKENGPTPFFDLPAGWSYKNKY